MSLGVTMEGETYRNYLDPTLTILKKLVDDLPEKFCHLKSPMQTMILDLKFFKMPKDNGVEIIYERLVFMLSFIVDPPEEDIAVRELILAKICTIINELPSLLCSTRDEKMEYQIISEAKHSTFLQKTDRVMIEVIRRYVKFQHSPEFIPPQIFAVGFLDFLLGNLDKMSKENVDLFPLVKLRVEKIQKELVSLRPFLQSIMESQNEHKELMDLSTQTINMIYNADYVIKLCLFTDVPIWYSIIFLYNVIQDIELIKSESNKKYNKRRLTLDITDCDVSPLQATNSKTERLFIGFQNDVDSVINHLTRGHKDLTIISISGLPGQGKTTLAKRIYNDPKIKFRFGKIVWCYISKEFEAEKVLINIIHEVCETDAKKTEIQDLVEHLRKGLKGQRYLIVMDDIWDVDAWRQIQQAFPNDENESRILFTSRNHDLALQAKSNSISHPLQLFSDEESFELIKMEVFGYNDFPQELRGIGKQIASYCKGLPLSAVLIAGFLGRIQKKLDLWEKVAENLKSHLATEGCMNIIELSYKYLAENLKPCFLYFAAFPRGESVSAKKLKLLWIAEGFIKDSEAQYLSDLANEYLESLISRSLVILTERSSMGRVKTCMVHDLLYDLCLEKAKKENIFIWAKKNFIVDQRHSNPQKYFHNRLCVGKPDPFIKSRTTCTRNELPASRIHSFLWFYYSYRRVLRYEATFWFVKSFKVLTILDLDGVLLDRDKSFEVILSLIHLRYLVLVFDCKIVGIPPSVVNLWNLETFIVQAGKVVDPLPISMWKMESLRHVDLPCAQLHLENFEENNSFSAYNIERLGTLVLKYDKQAMEFLKKLPKLRKLVCYLENNEHDPKWIFTCGSLPQLESLVISGCALKFSDLDQKCQMLNFLKIGNLVKLTLSNLQLPWSDMSTIGKQLPNLQVLKLNASACEGSRWNLEDVCFPKLKYLKLSHLSIEEMDASCCEDEPFPCLEQLVVLYCGKLKEIPSIFGDICTLMIIMLDKHSERLRASAEQILENQRDMGNEELQLCFFEPKGMATIREKIRVGFKSYMAALRFLNAAQNSTRVDGV